MFKLHKSNVENPPAESVNEKGHVVNVSESTLTVYLPEKAKGKKRPALLLIPGGGYALVDMQDYGESWIDYFTDQGFVCAVLKYRILGEFQQRVDDALEDAQKAIGILRSKSGDFGIDPKRIGVVGTSAGSHICLNLINDKMVKKGKEPDFLCLLCAWPGRNDIDYFSFTKHCPPTYMAVAKDDELTYNFVMQIKEKLGANPKFEIIEYPQGGHGVFDPNIGQAKEWYIKFNQWFQDNIL